MGTHYSWTQKITNLAKWLKWDRLLRLALFQMWMVFTSIKASRDLTTHSTNLFMRRLQRLTKSLQIIWIHASSSDVLQELLSICWLGVIQSVYDKIGRMSLL